MLAKVFENGRSQAVRLPKECCFDCEEVIVKRIGDLVILAPKDKKWDLFMQGIEMMSNDFMKDGREAYNQQERECLE